MERDKLGELERRLVEELTAQITAVERQIADAQGRLKTLKAKRAALTGETARRGASPLGLKVIAANNTLRRLKREGASKGDIAKAQKELDDLRGLLDVAKSSGGRR